MTNADLSPILPHKGKFHCVRLLSLVLAVEILPEKLVHGEHVNLLLLEHGSHGIVTADHAFVTWILKVVFADVGPYPLDGLGAR